MRREWTDALFACCRCKMKKRWMYAREDLDETKKMRL